MLPQLLVVMLMLNLSHQDTVQPRVKDLGFGVVWQVGASGTRPPRTIWCPVVR